MAIGPELGSGNFTARRAEFEAWAATTWLGAKRRLSARWMPIAAAIGILSVLLLERPRSTRSRCAISAVALLFAGALWPLDTMVLLQQMSGTAHVERAPQDTGLDRKGWRAVVDAIPTAALALDAAGSVVHHNRLVAELFPKIRNGLPLSQVLRNPDLIAAVDRALGEEERIDVELIERVPVERRVSATVSRLGNRRRHPRRSCS